MTTTETLLKEAILAIGDFADDLDAPSDIAFEAIVPFIRTQIAELQRQNAELLAGLTRLASIVDMYGANEGVRNDSLALIAKYEGGKCAVPGLTTDQCPSCLGGEYRCELATGHESDHLSTVRWDSRLGTEAKQ